VWLVLISRTPCLFRLIGRAVGQESRRAAELTQAETKVCFMRQRLTNFVHISAVGRSGLRDLTEGQKIKYEVEADRRTGKESTINLRSA
jgi:hypothetical protein